MEVFVFFLSVFNFLFEVVEIVKGWYRVFILIWLVVDFGNFKYGIIGGSYFVIGRKFCLWG